ncbi:MAG: VanZ family protein [Aquincola sp.]|nr:VanZ family protein [Aquincola sp.]MDH5331410.1 VanZ family protein [Aquincola sp.]
MIDLSPRAWRWLLAVVMFTGLAFALRPLDDMAPENWFPQSDKVFHLLFFGLLWWMGTRARLGSSIWLAVGLMAFAVGIEVAQALFTASRSASAADVLADGVGVLLGAWATPRLDAIASRRQPQKHGR